MFSDSDFNLVSGARATKIKKAHARSSATTRSMAASKMESTPKTGQWEDFPQVPVRNSGKHIERIIRRTVQCLADYKVSRKDVTGIIIKTASMIFGQHWSESAELLEPDSKSAMTNCRTSRMKSEITSNVVPPEIFHTYSHLIATLTSIWKMLVILTSKKPLSTL